MKWSEFTKTNPWNELRFLEEALVESLVLRSIETKYLSRERTLHQMLICRFKNVKLSNCINCKENQSNKQISKIGNGTADLPVTRYFVRFRKNCELLAGFCYGFMKCQLEAIGGMFTSCCICCTLHSPSRVEITMV